MGYLETLNSAMAGNGGWNGGSGGEGGDHPAVTVETRWGFVTITASGRRPPRLDQAVSLGVNPVKISRVSCSYEQELLLDPYGIL